MLNRRILRMKAFKVLFSSVFSRSTANPATLQTVQKEFELSLEATRDLYIYMLGAVPAITKIASSRLEASKGRINPSEDSSNPFERLAENRLSAILESDADFSKIFKKKGYNWDNYDLLLKAILDSASTKKWFKKYIDAPECTLSDDCRLFSRMYEEEFLELDEMYSMLEEKSLYWNDDLAYALSWCCRTFDNISAGGRWSMPELYLSDMPENRGKLDSDKAFATMLLRTAYNGYEKYSALVSEFASGWDSDRLSDVDICLIVMGLAEVAAFPELPLGVTLNEYVEISKVYCSPKSSSFINGMLDRIAKKLIADGDIKKLPNQQTL